MMRYPNIDPIAFSLGPLDVHWYGLAYLASFLLVWAFLRIRSRQPWSPVTATQIEDLIFYGALGVIVGGRLGYAFFYQPAALMENPLWIFRVWEGGMSFHGGLIGVLIAMFLYARRLGVGFLELGDMVAPAVPIGLLLGRLANFVGQELWGRPTSGWYAMIFPRDPQQLPRHPSQLYEAALEGLILFVLLYWISRQRRPVGLVSGLFLALYALFRFLVEFVREPDAHIDWFWLGWMTRGQMLCLPMLLVGLVLIVYAYRKPKIS